MDAERENEVSLQASLAVARWLLRYYDKEIRAAGIEHPDIVWMTPVAAAKARHAGDAVPIDEAHYGNAWKAWMWRSHFDHRSPSTQRTVPVFTESEIIRDEEEFDEDTDVDAVA